MTGWLIETLVASTLLMLLVLLVRERVATLFGARIAYLLWLLPGLRMILPPIPESAALAIRLDMSTLSPLPAEAPMPPMPPMPPMSLMPPMAVEPGFDWGMALLLLWLGGALAYLGWQLLAYLHYLRTTLSRAELLFEDAGIAVHRCDTVDGPMAAGIFRRHILLPRDFDTRYSRRELDLALAHEVAHHCRGDLIANCAALAILSLHWFNPVAHRAYRAFRTDQELACDETVLADVPVDQRHAYGTAVVKSATDRALIAACALNHKHQLKHRLKMMARRRNDRMRTLSGGALALAAIVAGLALTASDRLAAETVDAIEPPVVVEVPDVPEIPEVAELPELPAPPAPPHPVVHVAPPAVPHPPLPPKTDEEAREQARLAREQARLAREQAHEARRQAHEARRAALREVEAARRGAAIARAVQAQIDEHGITADVLEGLIEARADVAGEADIPSAARASALHSLDREIARLRRELAAR